MDIQIESKEAVTGFLDLPGITNDMARVTYLEREQSKLKKERIYLEGIVSDGRVAEADIL